MKVERDPPVVSFVTNDSCVCMVKRPAFSVVCANTCAKKPKRLVVGSIVEEANQDEEAE